MDAIYKNLKFSAFSATLLSAVSPLKADVPAAILGAVTDSDRYSLIYEAAIPAVGPSWGSEVEYFIDNSATGPANFDRVAYVMELDDTWVWVSYDTIAQANTLSKIGVPTVAVVDGKPIQTIVSNMDVFSSITDVNIIATGTGLTGGNIEFWPGNYIASNTNNIPNADSEAFDWGDGGAQVNAGYGSMQVHNHEAGQVLFAFNRWGGGVAGGTDIGIGNFTGGNPDYTFSETGFNFAKRNLYVLVREGSPLFPSPKLTGAGASVKGDKISLKFDQEIDGSSVDVANFSITGGLAITAAAVSGSNVVLTTSSLIRGTSYTISYTGVAGVPGAGQPLSDTLTIDITPPALPTLLATIPAAAGYELIYQAEIPESAPAWGNGASYVIDQSSFGDVTTFDRVAYIMELDDTWVWVSFDTLPQASTLALVGVPTVDVVNGFAIQTTLSNMDVFSSITDADIIATGTGLSTGNIEFWPGNYNASNANNIPNADSDAFDWGDGGAAAGSGYGSMQIHNHGASQVIFAFNRWGNGGGGTDIGIGNFTGGNPDYTFSETGFNFAKRNLYVLVRPGSPEFPSPELTGTNASLVGDQILLTFSDEISNSSVDADNFSIEGGPAITAAEASKNTVVLTTSGLVAGTTYTVNYTGVAGRRGRGVPLAETLTVEFTSPTVPTLPGTIPEAAGYELIYHAEIPETAPAWGDGASYLIDESSFSEATNFDRVAYIMELNGEWVFVSFDMLEQASKLSQIGVPTVGVVNGTPIQAIVSNMTVSSSLAGITQGKGLSGGNIEFWPGNFNGANDLNIPNASQDAFDFGDGGASAGLGYGSMQIHNHDASEVLFAFNRWGSGGGRSDIGIGTNTVEGQNPDYVFAENAGSFASRNLYVLVRRSASQIPQIIANNVPESRGYDLVYQLDLPGVNEYSGDAQSITEDYSVDNSATLKAGSRVAYVLQLDDEWVWVSFDAVTDDLTKIGVPHKGVWPSALQEIVTNMSVSSNAPQVTNGDFAEGNIEFWGGNYARTNGLGIENADDAVFDFDDLMAAAGGHGCMQVHNFMESEVVFAYNNWGSNGFGQAQGLGIGTNQGENPDWTFSGTSGNYSKRTLFVLTGNAYEIPLQITSISPDLSNNRVALTWTSFEGESFILSASNDLVNFTEIDDGIVGQEGSTTYVDIVPEGTVRQFYQVTKE